MGKKKGKVRPLALAIIWRDDRILVTEYYDTVKQQTFYRPMGGRIEFGEYGRDAVVREFREEINAEIVVERCLGTLENIFVHEGAPGHEIVLLYEARFSDSTLYAHESFVGQDDDEIPFNSYWKPLTFFEAGSPPLYPDGLLAMLKEGAGDAAQH